MSLAINYSLSESAELSTISREIQSELGTAPSGQSRFEINEQTRFGSLRKVVNLDVDRSGVGPESLMRQELQQEAQYVGNIRATFNADANYNNLKNTLINLFEEEGETRDIFSPRGIESGGYEIVCELEEPILLKDFMSKFDMESIQATTQEGIDIEFRETEIRLRNPNGGQLSEIFDKVVDIVTYYG